MCGPYRPDGKWQVWAGATGSWCVGSFDTHQEAEEVARRGSWAYGILFNAQVVEPDFRDPSKVDCYGYDIGSLTLVGSSSFLLPTVIG